MANRKRRSLAELNEVAIGLIEQYMSFRETECIDGILESSDKAEVAIIAVFAIAMLSMVDQRTFMTMLDNRRV